MSTQYDKLLTIAIPTYNRGRLLPMCLEALLSECKGLHEEIELIVSDNCSTDETDEYLRSLQASTDSWLRCLRNAQNIGPDGNFAECYKKARGKYLWVIGDDDIVLPGTLSVILARLRNAEYGAIYVHSYGFTNDWNVERPVHDLPNDAVIYDKPEEFVSEVGLMLTFVSGNIVNRSIVPATVPLGDYIGTNLIQLAWILPAVRGSAPRLVIRRYCIAARADNTGGYALCRVFGPNLDRMLGEFCGEGPVSLAANKIRKSVVRGFLPTQIVKARSRPKAFQRERTFGTLLPLFWQHIEFWLILLPCLFLPLKLARGYRDLLASIHRRRK